MFYQIITQIGILILVLIFMTGVLADCNKFEIFICGKVVRLITIRKTIVFRTCKSECTAIISPKFKQGIFKE